MSRALLLALLLLTALLAGCARCHESAPAVPDLGAPLACASDPHSPCPAGCACREHDRVCVPTPQRPEADCRRR